MKKFTNTAKKLIAINKKLKIFYLLGLNKKVRIQNLLLLRGWSLFRILYLL